MLTKTDIAAIRRADDLVIHLNPRHPAGLVRLIKRKPYNAKPFETDQEYVLEGVTVSIDGYKAKAALEAGAVQCFDSVGIYPDQNTPVSNVLKTLRAGDEIEFCFHPDYHCNGYVAAAGLHADSLILIVRRNGKRHAQWELASQVCADNSARMCRGAPNSESYHQSADQRRAMGV
jgi:hypothetical protein